MKAATSSAGAKASDYSSSDSGWRKLPAPINVVVTNEGGKVVVTWNAVTGASYYRVYRSTSSSGTKTAIGSWLSGTTYNDTSATPGTTYYYWVTAATSNSGAKESAFSSYANISVTLSAPTNVVASDGTYTDKVVITWTAVAGASYYRVYRAESATGTKTALGSWISGTTFNNTSAEAGKTYYYWVTAATSNSGAGESAFSAYDTGYVPGSIPIPAGVAATDGTYTDKVVVSWNASTGATHYHVYRSESSTGTKTSLGSWQTGRTYNDTTATPGTTYYYWVTAATSSSGANASDYSSSDSGWRALSAPTGVAATDGTDTAKVVVSWNASTGASYYRVYRSTSSSGTKTALGSWQTGRTYNDTSATPGTTYYYWVKAATSSSGANASDYSSSDSGWRKLSAPTNVVGNWNTDKIVITWTASAGASYYRVYRAESSTGTKTALGSWVSGTSFNNTTVETGKTYYYWVTAATSSSGANESGYSTLVIVNPPGPLPPTGVAASDGTYTDKVVVSWNASTGATHYHVYRSETSTGTKTSLGSWQAGRTYNDTSATPGTTYYYWVKAATSSSGANASDYSSSDSGWRKLSPPTNVAANYSSENNKVVVSWNASTGATYYHVYRAEGSATGTKTALGSWITGTTFSNTTVETGKTYYYWVTAATSSSGTRESDFSSPAPSVTIGPVPPDWKAQINYTAQYNMTLAAKIALADGSYAEAEGSLLGVFDANDVCCGYGDWTNTPFGIVYEGMVYSDETSVEGLTMKFWNAATGESEEIKETIDFEADAQIGSEAEPMVYHVKSPVIWTIKQGWNWVAMNITPADPSVTAIFADYTPSDGDQIKSATSSSTYYKRTQFTGWSPALNLQPGVMYMLRRQATGEEKVEITGTPCQAQNTISIKTGWNWIGLFTGAETATITSLVHSGGFAPNDQLKGQTASATYYITSSFTGWSGSLKQLANNQGYKLKVTNPGNLTITSGTRGAYDDADAIVRGGSCPWVAPDDATAYNMTFCVVLKNTDETYFENEDTVVGIFQGDTIIGNAVYTETPFGNIHWEHRQNDPPRRSRTELPLVRKIREAQNVFPTPFDPPKVFRHSIRPLAQ